MLSLQSHPFKGIRTAAANFQDISSLRNQENWSQESELTNYSNTANLSVDICKSYLVGLRCCVVTTTFQSKWFYDPIQLIQNRFTVKPESNTTKATDILMETKAQQVIKYRISLVMVQAKHICSSKPSQDQLNVKSNCRGTGVC